MTLPWKRCLAICSVQNGWICSSVDYYENASQSMVPCVIYKLKTCKTQNKKEQITHVWFSVTSMQLIHMNENTPSFTSELLLSAISRYLLFHSIKLFFFFSSISSFIHKIKSMFLQRQNKEHHCIQCSLCASTSVCSPRSCQPTMTSSCEMLWYIG